MIDFSKESILVVGDVMLDRYYLGKVHRISPEAPVPVVKVNEVKNTIGGAGNVVNNITHLGARSCLIGAVGKDSDGRIINQLLKKLGVQSCMIETGAPTITKVRVIGDHQQVVRLDFEEGVVLADKSIKKFKEHINKVINSIDIIIISDYGKGMCSDDVCRYIIHKSNGKGITCIVDPKGKDWHKYKGASIITPNLKEMSDALGVSIQNEDNAIEKHGREIIKKFQIEHLLVTRSDKGMTYISKEKTFHVPAEAKEVYDVSGAGDTVVATLAVALAHKIELIDAVKLANKAAGIVVTKFGTAPIEHRELINSINGITKNKIMPHGSLLKTLKELKMKHQRIVFTNGCFDIIHRGHVTYLREARKLGDILIVGVNSDGSVRKLKGKNRPLNNELDRMEILASLEFVDYVVLFKEETPYNLIKAIRPDILVKGGDYKVNEVAGREFAGDVKILPFVEGYSTTDIFEKSKL